MAEEDKFMRISAKDKLHIKHFIKELEIIRGRHTELISVYIPSEYDINGKLTQLQQEQGTATNIKSKGTRDSVITSLEKMIQHLKTFKKTPPNGLVVFSGNAANREGQQDYRVWSIEPPIPMKQNLYRCDKEFILDPLRDMADDKIIFGLVAMDKREGNVAFLKGKTIVPLKEMHSAVPGKHKTGGQCLIKKTSIQTSSGDIMSINKMHNPLSVLSMTKSHKLESTAITDKWDVKKEDIYTITTKYPRLELSCSKDHIFFVKKDKILELSAEELQEGDVLLMPEKIDISGQMQVLQSKDYKAYSVSNEGRQFIKKKRQELKLSQKELGKLTQLAQSSIGGFERGLFDFSENIIKRIIKVLKINFKDIKPFLTIKKNITLAKILNKELAQFIGYYLGDGSSEAERITLFEQREELAKIYKTLGEKLFNVEAKHKFRKDKNYHQIRLYGQVIVKFIKDNFYELKKAKDSSIPKKILESPSEIVAFFIKGLFDAEGYVSNYHVGLSLHNEEIIHQVQILLLRFGIISSFLTYDNNKNPYSKEIRYSVQISEKQSLELFKKHISFRASDKKNKLEKLISKKTSKSSVRQILAKGSEIRKLIEEAGFNSEKYNKANMFLRNKRLMSKELFKKTFIDTTKNKKLKEKFQEIYDKTILPVKIAKITKSKKPIEMVDISTGNQNFIANGLIVHNSAQRFERLREGAAIDFYKRIAKSMQDEFLESQTDIQGIIVGGPGHTKHDFVEGGYINDQLRRKIIGVKDLSYTGDFGLRELVDKSEDILSEEELVKEKQLMREFFEKLAREPSKVGYGAQDVLRLTKMGAVDKILVSESIDDATLDELEKAASELSSEVEIISVETQEGAQLKDIGKVAALLRYPVMD